MRHKLISLDNFVKNQVNKFSIPGAAVGIFTANHETYVCTGVTSIENPLPIDVDTLFITGSITKTFTATLILLLEAQGKVELHQPLLYYIPELKLKESFDLDKITIFHLLNHTSGLDWGITVDTGEGVDALAKYVLRLEQMKQISPSGTRTSYSQAGYNLLGRVIEQVTGMSYEDAVTTMLLKPLRLNNSFFNRDDIMTRRFSVGHNTGENGDLSVGRLWRRWRGENPGGGLVVSITDLLHWARFHLEDVTMFSEELTLHKQLIKKMKVSTAGLKGSKLGDAIGLSWFLKDINGVKLVGHGGSANGQFAELLLVPEHEFAIVSFANSSPYGVTFNQEVMKWGLKYFLNIDEEDKKILLFSESNAKEIKGEYENEVMKLSIRVQKKCFQLEVSIKPEIRQATDKELPPDYPACEFGLLIENNDEYVITTGGLKGQGGFFTRDESGTITGIDLAGRLFTKINTG